MTLSIELTPEQEARLTAAAKERGLLPVELAQELLIEHLPYVSFATGDCTSGEERDPRAMPETVPVDREADLETAWAETRRRMMAGFAADPELAAEFSAPLEEAPEDELLRRARAREFRNAQPRPGT